MAAFEIAAVTSLEDFKTLQHEWNVLVTSMEFSEIFYRWEWNWLCYKHLRDDSSLLILTVRNGKQLVGIAPLCLTTRRMTGNPVRVLEPIVTDVADYRNFLIGGDQHRRRILKGMLTWLHDNRDAWDIIELSHFSSCDCTTFHIATLAATFPDLACNMQILSRTPRLYYRNFPGKADAKQIGWIKTRRALLKKEGFTFRIGIADSDEFWSEFWRLHRLRWNTEWKDGSRIAAFYDALRQDLGSQGLLECSVAEFESRPVAMHFGFRDGKKVYFYMPVMDIGFKKQRIGAILANEIIDVYSSSYQQCDLLRGDEEYKYWWTDDVAVNYRLTLFYGNNLAGLAYNFPDAVKGFARSLAAPRYLLNRISNLWRKGASSRVGEP